MSDSFSSSYLVPFIPKTSPLFRKTWLLRLGIVLSLPGVLPLSFLSLCLAPRPMFAQSNTRLQARSQQKETYYVFMVHNSQVTSWNQLQLLALRQIFGVDDQTARLLHQSIIWQSATTLAWVGNIKVGLEAGLYQRILQQLGSGKKLEAEDFSPPPSGQGTQTKKSFSRAKALIPGKTAKPPKTGVKKDPLERTTSSGNSSPNPRGQEQGSDSSSSLSPTTSSLASSDSGLSISPFSSHSLSSSSGSSGSDSNPSTLSSSTSSPASASFSSRASFGSRLSYPEEGVAGNEEKQLIEGAKQLFTQRTGALAKSAEKTHPGLLNALAQHLQQAQRELDVLPPEIQNELLLAGSAKGTALTKAYPAKEWPTVVRLARKLATLSDFERQFYSLLSSSSSNLDAVEKSLDLFLSMRHELQTAPKPVSSPKLQEQNQKSEEDLMGKEVAEAMWKDFDVEQLKTLSVKQKRVLARKLMEKGSNAQLLHMVRHPVSTLSTIIKNLGNVQEFKQGVSQSLDALKRKDLSSYERYAEQFGLGGHISGFAAGWLGLLALACAPELAAVVATTALILAVESVICSTVETELRIEAAAQAQNETDFITHTTKAAQADANARASAVMLLLFEGVRVLGKMPPIQKYLIPLKQKLSTGLRRVDFLLWKKGAFQQALAAYQKEVLRFFQSLADEQTALTQKINKIHSGEELLQKIIAGEEDLQKWTSLTQERALLLQEQLQGLVGTEALHALLARFKQVQAQMAHRIRLFEQSLQSKIQSHQQALGKTKSAAEALKLLEAWEEEFSEASLWKHRKAFWEQQAKEQLEALSQTEAASTSNQEPLSQEPADTGTPGEHPGNSGSFLEQSPLSQELSPPQDSAMSLEPPQDPVISAKAPSEEAAPQEISLEIPPDTLQKMKVTLARLQEQSFAYKGLSFEKFFELIQEDWKQHRYQGAKTRTLAEQVEAMRLGLEEILRLRAVAEVLWKAEQALPKDKRPNPTQKISKMTPGENVAYATIQVEGLVKKVLAVSRDKVNLPKEVGGYEVVDPKNFKGQQVFEPKAVEGEDFDRGTDSEYRILEYVARELKHQMGENAASVKGYIDLFSERYFCESCGNIISAFQEKFQGIKIKYNSGPRRPPIEK